MKRFVYTLIFVIAFCGSVSAQTQDPEALHQTGRSFMRQGDYPSAIQAFDKALEIKPNDVDIMKDKAFVFYLQRDFAGTIDLCKKIIALPDATAQSYQILGLAYKAIAEDKANEAMYKEALTRFPNSGALNSDYGELLSANKKETEAIKYWEKGIAGDPNYSGNYYFATKYYAQHGNIVWGLLYGEMFVNLESLSKRTDEIKGIIYGGYKNLFANPTLLDDIKETGTSFEKTFATSVGNLSFFMRYTLTPETLTAMRTRFILNWFSPTTGAARQFPFKLFENQRSMLQEGYFEAYSQWLIGPTADTQKFQAWTAANPDALTGLQQFQRNNLFKVPANQYYPH